jgi:pyruvate,orthophosphate dikinase
MAKAETQIKWVYLIREGNGDMKDLLGGKGAGLAEMTRAQLPVPPGFIVTTGACNSYNKLGGEFPQGMWHQVIEGMRDLEVQTEKVFGEFSNPLLVSVRSGAKVSMPGMMDTILNLGLNDETVNGLAQTSGGERFAYDSYRRFIQMFGKVVLEIPSEEFETLLDAYKKRVGAASDSEVSAEGWKEVVAEFKSLVRKETQEEFPQDPYGQLRLAVKAVFDSWNGKPAVDYRNFYGISHDLGTAVNVVAMVFGNMDENSGTGVVFTRNPSTGEKHLYGEYLFNAQGEDVVAGTRTPQNIALLAQVSPELYRQLNEIAQRLETRYRDAQDMEFTIERGVLYMLQTRAAKRTAEAAVKIAVDMKTEGLITKEEALKRVEPLQINQLLLPGFAEKAKEQAIAVGDMLATGLNASPGAASGKVVFDPDRAQELGTQGEEVILVRTETSPDDIHGMLSSQGVLTSRGGATSHAAVVARGLGKPCVVGCEALVVDAEAKQCSIGGRVIQEMEEISIDGTTGEVFVGRLPTRDPNVADKRELSILLGWADEVRKLGVWANADTPEDAQRALEFGAEGIGLCRTEHMFFAEDRLPFVQQMILAAPEATVLEDLLRKVQDDTKAASARLRPQQEIKLEEQDASVAASPAVKRYREALAKLFEFQTQDFTAILRVMTGKPVIIRLIDPPLHEFLPRYEDLLREVLELRGKNGDDVALRDKERLLETVEGLREVNPMLGLRGCRLGIMYEAINEMQARAIITAACDLAKEGWDPRPEIMVPLVGHANELSLIRRIIERVLEEVQREKGIEVPYKIGTMIELPRAALTADKIAEHAEFFSFGTNDLTQTTYGFSRDDAEGKFLRHYVEWGILPENPFQVLDRDGVGELVKLGVDRGRSTKPDLEVGICGEHGGDPASIQFCHQVGLDYVSASPFRLAVARLAAAQAALDPQVS